jgi:hypothetical protein
MDRIDRIDGIIMGSPEDGSKSAGERRDELEHGL